MIQEKIGIVVSDKMNKTRVIQVQRSVRHPFYRKILRLRKKYYAHDESNGSKVGSRVRIRETRPLSRLKRWEIVEILEERHPNS